MYASFVFILLAASQSKLVGAIQNEDEIQELMNEKLKMKIPITSLDEEFMKRSAVTLDDFIDILTKASPDIKKIMNNVEKEDFTKPYDTLHGHPGTFPSQLAFELNKLNKDTTNFSISEMKVWPLIKVHFDTFYPITNNSLMDKVLIKSNANSFRNFAMLANVAFNLAPSNFKVDVNSILNKQPAHIKVLIENLLKLKKKILFFLYQILERGNYKIQDAVKSLPDFIVDSITIVISSCVENTLSDQTRTVLLEALTVLTNRVLSNYEATSIAQEIKNNLLKAKLTKTTK